MSNRLTALRWPILGLSAFVCAGFCIFLFAYAGAVAASGAEALAISAASGAAGFWLLRSGRLALLALAVPAVTAILALGILTPVATMFPALCSVLIPHAIATVLLVVSSAGLAILYRFLGEQCAGSDPDVAAQTATAAMRRAAVMALAGAALWRAFLLLPERVLHLNTPVASTDVSVLAAVVTALGGMIALFLLLPLAAGIIRFDENFIALANRVREARTRVLGFLALAVMPRWAMAVLGIAIVFTAMAAFGHPPLVALWREQGLLFPLVLLLLGAIATAGTRDWRAFLACALSAALAGSLGAVWCADGAAVALKSADLATLCWIGGAPLLPITAALSAACSYAVLARAAAYRTLEDAFDVAFERALSDVAMPLICSCVSFAAILLPARLSLLPLIALVTGSIVTPAVLAVLEMIFPRYRSVEELYGRG